MFFHSPLCLSMGVGSTETIFFGLGVLTIASMHRMVPGPRTHQILFPKFTKHPTTIYPMHHWHHQAPCRLHHQAQPPTPTTPAFIFRKPQSCWGKAKKGCKSESLNFAPTPPPGSFACQLWSAKALSVIQDFQRAKTPFAGIFWMLLDLCIIFLCSFLSFVYMSFLIALASNLGNSESELPKDWWYLRRFNQRNQQISSSKLEQASKRPWQTFWTSVPDK